VNVLHLTDTHLGHEARFIGAPDGWRRADDHHDAMVRALEPVWRGEIDLVVHSGDVFDRSRPPPGDVERALATFAEVGRRVPIVIVAGNHDRLGLARHLAPPGVTLLDEPRHLVIGGARFGFVPYAPTAAAFGEATAQLGAVDLLVCHQAFDGVRIPRRSRDFVFREGRQRDTVGPDHVAGVGAVACGHIHPRQVVRYGALPVVHPGSTERTALAERAQTKGYAVWTLGRRVSWRFVDLPARPMRKVDETTLDRVRPGDLVYVHDRRWLGAALARGGWVAPPRSHRGPDSQLALFGGVSGPSSSRGSTRPRAR